MDDDVWDNSKIEILDDGAPAPNRCRRWGAALAIAAVATLSLATLVIVAVRVVQLVQPKQPPDFIPNGALEVGRAAGRDAFAGYDKLARDRASRSGQQLADVHAIQARLDQVAAWTKANDSESFRDAVDWPRFMARLKDSGHVDDVGRVEMAGYSVELRDMIECDGQWSDFELVDIVETSEHPNSRLVYCFGRYSKYDDEVPWRFWMSRDGDQWQFYDWQQLDLGLAESTYYALLVKYHRIGQIDGFYSWIDAMRESDELIADDRADEAQAALRRGEQEPIPPELRDYCWVLAGMRWSNLDEPDEAERCFSCVQRPMETPGAFYHRMAVHRWQEPAVALDAANAFEDAVGPTPTLLQIKAQLLVDLNRQGEAVDAWRRLLRMRPDSLAALTEWYKALPADESGEFEAYLSHLDNGPSVAAELVATLIEDDQDQISPLVDYLERVAPDAAATHFARGAVAEWDGKILQACRSYQQAFDAEDDEDRRNTYMSSLLQASAEAGRLLEPLRQADVDESAFETVAYLMDEWEIEFTREEQLEFARLYIECFPESPRACSQQFAVALADHDYATVKQLAPAAIERIESHGGDAGDEETSYDEYGYDPSATLTWQLALARLRSDQVVAAYRTFDDLDESFDRLLWAAREAGQWEAIHQLMELHERESPADPQLSVARGDASAHAGDDAQAVTHYQKALKSLTQYEEILVRQRLIKVACRADAWRDCYAQAADRRDMFSAMADFMGEARRWSDLAELIELHRSADAADPQLLAYESRLAWGREHFALYVKMADELLDREGDDALDEFDSSVIVQRRFVALLRTGDLQRLRTLTDKVLHPDVEPLDRAVYLAAAGRGRDAAEAAREALAEANSNALYWHESAGQRFLSSQYAELQQEFPVPMDAPLHTAEVVFVDEPVEIQPADLLAGLRKLGMSGRVTGVRRMNSKGQTTVGRVVSLFEGRMWVVAGSGPFDAAWDLDWIDRGELAAIRDSQHWVAFGVMAFEESRRRELAAAARKVAAGLLQDRLRAVAHRRWPPWRGYVALVPETAPARAWASGEEPAHTWDDLAEISIVDYSPHASRDRAFRAGVYKAVRHLEANPLTTLTVWVHVDPAAQADPLRIEVARAKRSAWGWELSGRLLDDSALAPELHAGMPVSVRIDQLIAWQASGKSIVLRQP